MSSRKLCIVLGVGPGTGLAVCRAFAKKGYTIGMLARSKDKLEAFKADLKKEGYESEAFTCDITSEESITSALDNVNSIFKGAILKAAVFNAGPGFSMAPFAETKISTVKSGLDATLGAFVFMQHTAKTMLEHKQGGTILVTGATASIRAGAKFSAFAASKFALRALTQSAARSLGPDNIHVAHIIVDGLIDTERVAGMAGKAEDKDTRLSPDSIARAYVYLEEQDKSCWTQELDLRPSAETF